MIKKYMFIFLTMFVLNITADEGMWEPYQMKSLQKELRASGYKGSVANVSDLFKHPMNAIVSLGGCSAAFVSDQGLIATNYHCIERSYLQFNSNAESDLFETGFVARTKDDEKRSAPGSRVYVTLESTDITNKVLDGLSDDTAALERAEIIEDNKKAIIRECETSDEFECRVRSFFSGETYKLEKVLKIKDVRLVYAPPSYIGEYGGEIDNWMYPRHTGDFALLRAYTAKDGSSKEFNKDNVPYKSDSFLKVSAKGVKDGDFVMVVGYPGRTNRTITFNEELVSKEFILCCENIKSSFTKGKPIGYIEKFDDNLMYISGTGDLFVMSINSLNTYSVTDFKRVNSNFRDLVKNEYVYGIDERFGWGGWESVKNIFYDKGNLYISYIDETDNDCATLSILKGEANLIDIKFSKFFSLDECIPRTNDNYTGIQSGGAIANYDDENLIFTTGDFRQRLFPQNQNSQYGKTLKINKNNGEYQILSMGHRNPQGIKKIQDDLFISTEHGPRMGDEINLIDTSDIKNYGWPIASYGVHYDSNFGINFIFEELTNAPLHKSHSEYGFEEPIYYFGFDKTIEHGISDIEIISNNESTLDFMFGSLHYGRLYIASYNLVNSSMQSLKSFNIQNRIRDLLKISKNDYIALLENPPRLAVITLKNN